VLAGVTVEGYTSIRSARLDLRALNVLVGPNGAGKSNIIGVLEMLGRIADEELQYFVGLRGGAGSLLHGGPDGSTAVGLRVECPPNVYEARLVPSARDEFVFDDETVSFHGHGGEVDPPHVWRLGRGHACTSAGSWGWTPVEVENEVQALLRQARADLAVDGGRAVGEGERP
jgi:predicted ATPase